MTLHTSYAVLIVELLLLSKTLGISSATTSRTGDDADRPLSVKHTHTNRSEVTDSWGCKEVRVPELLSRNDKETLNATALKRRRLTQRLV